MFWPVILPFEITFCLTVVAIIMAVFFAPRFHRSRDKVLLWALLISFGAFIPSCASVMWAIDPFRFGSFEYKDYKDVKDRHLERYLPRSAKGIAAHVSGNGFTARYRISRKDLEGWLAQQWQMKGSNSVTTYSPPKPVEAGELEWINSLFSNPKWAITQGMIAFEGPREGDGGGSTIYFSEGQGIAYQRANYW